jgi:predicted nucleic acid-binding protein
VLAVDSSSLIAFFSGDAAADTAMVHEALLEARVALPPPVLSEVLCQPNTPLNIQQLLVRLPILSPTEGYWLRAALLRRKLFEHKHKAKLGDSLIAQSCIDHDVPLLTRDSDFKHFAKHGGLKLVKP